MPWLVRENKVRSRCFSRALICLITAVDEIYRASAALLKLPLSATWTKVVSWLLYTGGPSFCSNFLLLPWYKIDSSLSREGALK